MDIKSLNNVGLPIVPIFSAIIESYYYHNQELLEEEWTMFLLTLENWPDIRRWENEIFWEFVEDSFYKNWSQTNA